ncbi:MAG: 16S rRNA (uracil(1498)-N(3))-methyltransferase [Culturomica sp.]|jgi:16S rRNA (uracil1498-N3)-methyltransferase|nr:16S rRNA (uracil(1498)-N(3))-methyltransferase [Culturomica sp.]
MTNNLHVFYTPSLNGDEHVLSPEESKHCIRSLRLQTGDAVVLTDGNGGIYEGKIKYADPKGCVISDFKVCKKLTYFGWHPFYLHLAVAPTKSPDRMEWLAEKCTEIGVDEITFFTSEHSERKQIKTERLQRIMVAAMKQSQKAYLPTLKTDVSIEDIIRMPFDGRKFIAHCHEGEKKRLDEVYTEGENALILIGPEGDFSEKEVATAVSAGFIPITLGNSRLRTETAGIVACHSINFLNKC